MKYFLRALGLAFGAFIYTLGLDVFLVPNHVIDGGVVGIALMAAELTGVSFSIFIIVLNIPFFIFGYKKSVPFLPCHRSFRFFVCPYGAISSTIRRSRQIPFYRPFTAASSSVSVSASSFAGAGPLTARKSWPSSPIVRCLFLSAKSLCSSTSSF